MRSLLPGLGVRLRGWISQLGRRPAQLVERLGWSFAERTLGERGERAAERHLKRLGYKIVARRDRTVLGELDLVAVDGRTVVFVEVKTRHAHGAGHPVDAVDQAKQARLTRLATAYLKRHDLLENPARFDVVAVTWPAGARRPEVSHIAGAFEATGIGGLFG